LSEESTVCVTGAEEGAPWAHAIKLIEMIPAPIAILRAVPVLLFTINCSPDIALPGGHPNLRRVHIDLGIAALAGQLEIVCRSSGDCRALGYGRPR
jgi:hypothetical protein